MGREEAELAAAQGSRQGGDPSVRVATAQPREIVSGLTAVGSIESQFRVQISPRISGRIEYLVVREGDRVSAGDVILRLDQTELQGQVVQFEANLAEARSRAAQAQINLAPGDVSIESQIAQQEAAVMSATADLNQAISNVQAQVADAEAAIVDARGRLTAAQAQERNSRAELARQQAVLENARSNLERQQSLLDQGFVAERVVEDARTAVAVQERAVEVAQGQIQAAESAISSAQAQLDSATNQQGITKTRAEADVEVMRARLAQAEAQLQSARANRAQGPAARQNVEALRSSVRSAEAQLQQARARLNESVIRAPISGVVTVRNSDPGALASPGQPVLVIQSLDALFFTATVPVEDSGNFSIGDPVQVVLDSMPGETFNGPIEYVNPFADDQSRRVTFRVRLENLDARIRPGMFGRVEIPTSSVAAAVVVPREAVNNGPGGRTTVMVVDTENVAHEREVVLGASDTTYVQIVEGVMEGEQVIVLTFRPVRDGQTVQLDDSGGPEPEEGARGSP